MQRSTGKMKQWRANGNTRWAPGGELELSTVCILPLNAAKPESGQNLRLCDITHIGIIISVVIYSACNCIFKVCSTCRYL